MRHAIVIVAIAALAAGCGGRDTTFDDRYAVVGPSPSGGTVFYVNKPLKHLLWLDVGDRTMHRERLEYTVDLVVPIAAAGKAGLVALDEGVFRVFDTATRKTEVEIALGAPYDAFRYTPDGRHIIATSSLSQEALLASGIIGYLPGQLIVLDVDRGYAPRIVTVGKDISQGALVFPPAEAPAGATMAAILVPQGIVVFDYADSGVPARFQPLGYPGSEPSPSSAVFSYDAKILFATAQGSSDVFALTVARDGGRFTTTLNFLSSASAIGQIATVDEPGLLDRVAAFYPDGQEVVVLSANAVTSEELHISVPGLYAYAGTVRDDGGRPWLAATAAGGVVSFIDPTTGEVRSTSLTGGIGWTKTVSGGGGRYLLVESRPDNREAVTALSLYTEIQDGAPVTKVHLFPVMLTDLVADTIVGGTTAYLAFENAKAVGRMDLAIDQFGKRDLPARAARASLVGKETVFVDHEQTWEIGLASVADMTPGSTDEVFTLEGFLVDGLLDP